MDGLPVNESIGAAHAAGGSQRGEKARFGLHQAGTVQWIPEPDSQLGKLPPPLGQVRDMVGGFFPQRPARKNTREFDKARQFGASLVQCSALSRMVLPGRAKSRDPFYFNIRLSASVKELAPRRGKNVEDASQLREA